MLTKIIFYLLIVPIMVLTATEFWAVASSVVDHLGDYQWLLYGMLLYLVVHRLSLYNRNEEWLRTANHEWSHALVAMLFLHRIHSLQSGKNSGAVSHSGTKLGALFITLAPYALPLFTYFTMGVRFLGAEDKLFVFDLFIGFTLMFHLLSLWHEARPHQTDLQRNGLLLSYLYIIVAWLFNFTVILLCVRVGIVDAFVVLFRSYYTDVVGWLAMV